MDHGSCKSHTSLLQVSYKSPASLLHASYKSPPCLLQVSYKSPTSLIQVSYKSPTSLLQVSYKSSRSLLKGSYKSLTSLGQIHYKSQTYKGHWSWVMGGVRDMGKSLTTRTRRYCSRYTSLNKLDLSKSTGNFFSLKRIVQKRSCNAPPPHNA